MAYSVVDICNLALGRIGSDRTIASLDEASKEARNCKRFYPLARDEVLEKAVWPSLVRVKALALLPTATLLPGWQYAYAQPVDMASVAGVIPAGEVASVAGAISDCCGPWMPSMKDRYAFRRALSDDGLTPVILSNVPDAHAVYSASVTNTGAFSTLMVSLIADRLAMELSMPMTADPRWFQVAQQRYAHSWIDTASRAFEQERHGPEAEPPSIRARY